MTVRDSDLAQADGLPGSAPQWWREAVVYQMYPRSFADGNGDGIGDLIGAREHLDHLSELGVDAVWLNPWYKSPMADAGYDVADYREIDPGYGDLETAERFIADAHARDIRIIADIVPNHVSSEHVWFQAALRDEPGYRDRFIFRQGRGADGSQPPNNWESNFGGPAWTRLDDGLWYLHLFAPEQPDLNWRNPAVRAEFESVLRFWFERGIDGFRIDVAHGLVKHPDLPDSAPRSAGAQHVSAHPAYDQDELHEIYRSWRTIADSYDPPRIFVAEAWVPSNERLARYLRPDELHTAFQFDFLRAPWRAEVIREVIDDAITQVKGVSAPPTWVLANHDVARIATRYARSQPNHLVEPDWERARWSKETPDLELGRRRARAAALLQLALPGTAYVYQGDELGLDEYEDLPNEARQDPMYPMFGFTDPGRDGCRAPIPWAGDVAPYGFSAASAEQTWLPQPDGWANFTVEHEDADPDSILNLYRKALRTRRELFLGAPDLEWIAGTDDGVLAFRRGDAECWVNTGGPTVDLPAQAEIIVSSDPHAQNGTLPADTAVWLTRGAVS
ncbi:MAG: glycoside hydrolase family 13 protein [Gordonia sp. (in: high G+C Gram-positive bacteria)]